MLPTQNNFQHFVPDQLLTSDHLNQLFEYLDEQNRLTRTNLVGIGIVCGLEVKVNATGTAITITKGCGVTSEGYLVSVPETTYTQYKSYDAVKDRLYSKFVDAGRNQRFPLKELVQAGVTEGTTQLTQAFLNDKVVLIFVEILEEAAKNCNPNSCDDKGVNVTVSFKPLLISKSDVTTLLSGVGNTEAAYLSLPDIVIRRFDVPATNMLETADIFAGYQKILNASFIKDVQDDLTSAYNIISPLVSDIYGSNPFSTISSHFAFLHNGSIDSDQLVNYQYFYDLFSDLIYAYNELRETGMELISMCCPDSNLFPRHLLLDLAIPDSTATVSDYRQYFIASPVMGCSCHQVKELRQLFIRLVEMLKKFELPSAGGFSRRFKNPTDDKIKITPSKLGDIPLSNKAIPFYYKVNEGTQPLYKYWDPVRTKRGTANKILSYNAKDYNTTDDYVTDPLLFDLEPYNFLRIEGHIGKPYTRALSSIISLKNKYRLPFDVIALNADVRTLRTQLRNIEANAIDKVNIAKGVSESMCHFQDLEALYKTLAAELICTLCKEVQYYYMAPGANRNATAPTAPTSNVPQITLLQKCAPNFRIVPGTFGQDFEAYYATIKNYPYANAATFLANLSIGGAAVVGNPYFLGFALIYYMEQVSKVVTDDLSDFDIRTFVSRFNDLETIVFVLKAAIINNAGGKTDPFSEDVIDHLDVLWGICKEKQFTALYKEYLQRKLYVMLLQRFGYFVRMHPGIQHKAGVTMGGTFILVYHEAEEEETDNNDGIAVAAGVANNDFTNVAMKREDVKAAPAPEMLARRYAPKAEMEKTEEEAKVEAAPAPEERIYMSYMPGADTAKTGLTIEEDKENLARAKKLAGEQTPNHVTADTIKEILGAKLSEKDISQDLIDELEDGMVIADFYLPYLCYSDCPPIQFMINTKEPAQTVSISITPKEFCSADDKTYPITVSPEGGTITGEGVTKDDTGTTVFAPQKVPLGDSTKKVVTLTYVADGESASTTVTVYAKPSVTFDASPGSTPTIIFFQSDIKNAEKFEWDFGDNTTSSEANPTHDFKKDGSYKVVLTAYNGVCSAEESRTVDIKTAGSLKTCLPTNDIMEAYRGLPDVDKKNWDNFIKAFSLYDNILVLFSQLAEDVFPFPEEQQIEYFRKQDIPEFLVKVLRELDDLISKNETFRLLALAFHRVLVALSMYIACIQKEDIVDAPVKMDNVFIMIQGQLNRWAPMVPNFTAPQKAQLKILLNAIDAEADRLVVNNEQKTKLQYALILSKCIEIMEKYPL